MFGFFLNLTVASWAARPGYWEWPRVSSPGVSSAMSLMPSVLGDHRDCTFWVPPQLLKWLRSPTCDKQTLWYLF
ncbi:hypothetical protein Y1Q_0022678 [Alligator mississippiensis]|uniref:Secreted protein n=1 Tax=Alligator mississippiensis TaxID=8496 RepID=A0A151PHI5_ALLMI|nr:hypothetical protein Y1Q_0022678 [Alligator mississippiensis]